MSNRIQDDTPIQTPFELGKKSHLDIWARKKSRSYFQLNPGRLTGVLMSWFMKKSPRNWVVLHPLYTRQTTRGPFSLLIRISPNITKSHQQMQRCQPAIRKKIAFSIPSWFSGIMRNYPWLYLRDKFDKPWKIISRNLKQPGFQWFHRKSGCISDVWSHLSKIRRHFALNHDCWRNSNTSPKLHILGWLDCEH